MEWTKLPLHKWALAVWLVVNEPAISVRNLGTKVGVPFKTAWRLGRRIRDGAVA